MLDLVLAIGAVSVFLLIIPLILMLVFIMQGRIVPAVVCGAILLFLISPTLALILLLVGAIVNMLIGRPDLAKVCVLTFIGILLVYVVLVAVGVVTLVAIS